MPKFNLKSNSSNSNENHKKFLLKAKLALYLKRGMDLQQAVKLAGITDFQLGQMRTDPDFEEFINKCQIQCEHDHLKNIETAGNIGAWQASAWYLERKYPDKYGKKDTIKHEYQLKIDNFKAMIIAVINDLPPNVRQLVMQKLRTINTEEHQMLIENKSNVIDITDVKTISKSSSVGV